MTNPNIREGEAQRKVVDKYSPKKGKKYFDLNEANHAIGYVSRVIADLMATYHNIVDTRRRIEHPFLGDSLEHLEAAYETTLEKLSKLVDELHDVGVELKDFEKGIVDFPAVHPSKDREIYLCWQHGESAIRYWREVHDGTKGRKDISTLL